MHRGASITAQEKEALLPSLETLARSGRLTYHQAERAELWLQWGATEPEHGLEFRFGFGRLELEVAGPAALPLGEVVEVVQALTRIQRRWVRDRIHASYSQELTAARLELELLDFEAEEPASPAVARSVLAQACVSARKLITELADD